MPYRAASKRTTTATAQQSQERDADTDEIGHDEVMSEQVVPQTVQDVRVEETDLSDAIHTLCDNVDALNEAVLSFNGTDAEQSVLEPRIAALKEKLLAAIETHGSLGQLLVRVRDALTAIVAVAKSKTDAQKLLTEKRINLKK